MRTTAVPRPRRRCGGSLARIVLLIVLVSIIILLIDAVFNPYSFFLGGRFHVQPGWQGSGWIRSPAAGGDYFLFVRFTPAPDSGLHKHSHLKGVGYLCTPRGKRFRLYVGADMARHLTTNTTGQPIRIYATDSSHLRDFRNTRRPSIDLSGVWGNGEIVMQEHGSLENVFQPDGTLYPLAARNRPPSKENVTVTLKERPWWEWNPACPSK